MNLALSVRGASDQINEGLPEERALGERPLRPPLRGRPRQLSRHLRGLAAPAHGQLRRRSARGGSTAGERSFGSPRSHPSNKGSYRKPVLCLFSIHLLEIGINLILTPVHHISSRSAAIGLRTPFCPPCPGSGESCTRRRSLSWTGCSDPWRATSSAGTRPITAR